MQMNKLYETTNKKLRASRLRKEGRELQRAGFIDSANQNFELAAYIDPPTPEVQESNNESDSGSVRGNHMRGRSDNSHTTVRGRSVAGGASQGCSNHVSNESGRQANPSASKGTRRAA